MLPPHRYQHLSIQHDVVSVVVLVRPVHRPLEHVGLDCAGVPCVIAADDLHPVAAFGCQDVVSLFAIGPNREEWRRIHGESLCFRENLVILLQSLAF